MLNFCPSLRQLNATLMVGIVSITGMQLTQAQVVWDGAGDGLTWGDDDNWVGGVKPSGSDSPQLDGASVIVDSVESYTGFTATGDNGMLTINNGGELTANANGNAFRHVDGVTINSGGKLFSASTNNIRSAFLTINSGGELTGTDSIFDGDTITVGGVFRPMDSVDGSNEFTIGSATTGGTFNMASTGTLILDLFGDGANESIVINDRDAIVSDLDLSVGSIVLEAQGYTPQFGDSFVIWTDLMTGGISNNVTPGDGSNITLSGYQLDLSQWETNGVVTVVPEPSSVIFVAVASLAIFARRRRR